MRDHIKLSLKLCFADSVWAALAWWIFGGHHLLDEFPDYIGLRLAGLNHNNEPTEVLFEVRAIFAR